MESVHDFSSRFMRSYDSIPSHVKPPPGVAQLHYANSFNNNFSLTLRERRSTSLVDMMNGAIEVKVNLKASG